MIDRAASWPPLVRLFIASQFLALMADRAMSLIYVTLAEQRASAGASGGSSASLLAAAQVLPILLFSPLGGIIADRFDKKWVMWWADVGRLLVVIAFLVANSMIALGLNDLLIVVVLLGTLTAAFNPAKKSLLPFLVNRNQLESASAVVSGSEVLAMLMGLAVGTALLKLVSSNTALAVNSVFVICAIVLLTFLKPSAQKANSAMAPATRFELAAALRHIASSRTLMTAIFGVNVPFYLAAAFFFAGATAFASKLNPNNAGGELGPLLLALCIGAVLSIASQRLLGLSRMSLKAQVVLPFGGAAVTVITCDVLLHWLNVGWLRFALFGLTGAFVGLLYVRTVALLQRICSSDLLGRVIGVNEVLSALSFVVVLGGVGLMPIAPDETMLMVCSALILFLGGVAANFGFGENASIDAP